MPAPHDAELCPNRRLIEVTGTEAIGFLQGLVTNDLRRLGQDDGLIWAALLTPQGKYLADFLIARSGGRLLIDLPEALAENTLRRLAMYRLRADVALTPAAGLVVNRGFGPAPAGALPDPRHPALGWRHYTDTPAAPPTPGWDALRVAHVIPESGIELIPDDSYILEAGFERLNGVDFRKSCYVGQEVTARMKHKTELRKGLVRVHLAGPLPDDLPIGAPVMAGEREAGRLFTRAGDRALAHLRLDRAEGPMTVAGVAVTLDPDSP